MYRYDVDADARLVIATFEGEVSDADLFDYLSDMLANTRYHAGWGSLIDLTPAQAIKLTSAGIQRMRALPLYMEERLHGARAAVLALEGSDAYDIARTYQQMGKAAAYEVRVFSDREKAMQWLLAERSAT